MTFEELDAETRSAQAELDAIREQEVIPAIAAHGALVRGRNSDGSFRRRPGVSIGAADDAWLALQAARERERQAMARLDRVSRQVLPDVDRDAIRREAAGQAQEQAESARRTLDALKQSITALAEAERRAGVGADWVRRRGALSVHVDGGLAQAYDVLDARLKVDEHALARVAAGDAQVAPKRLVTAPGAADQSLAFNSGPSW